MDGGRCGALATFSLRRAGHVALQAAAAAGAVCAALLWLFAPMAGWVDWSTDPWAQAPARAVEVAIPASAPPDALVSLIEMRDGGRPPVRMEVLRDGEVIGSLAAGPLTIAMRKGDQIGFRNPGTFPVAVRILASDGLRWPLRGDRFTAPAGVRTAWTAR